MLRISKAYAVDDMRKDNAPAAYCESGETVAFECRNCYDDKLTLEGIPDEEHSLHNPATGPLYVRGAEPGDILKVEILDITLEGKGYMFHRLGNGAFAGRPDITEARVREFDVSGTDLRFNDRLSFPIDTMIGVIGCAAAEGVWETVLPGDHGGNLDCRRIVKGATLYLPVNVSGALLGMGDMHAVMGDGEVLVCGVESAGTATVRVTVVKGEKLPTPCLITSDGANFATIQSEKDLMTASKKACNMMLDYLLANTDLDVYDGTRLLSIAGNLIICQIVNDYPTVRMEIDKGILDKYGIKLP